MPKLEMGFRSQAARRFDGAHPLRGRKYPDRPRARTCAQGNQDGEGQRAGLRRRRDGGRHRRPFQTQGRRGGRASPRPNEAAAMIPLLIGLAVLLFVLGAMRLVAQVDAHMLARNLRRGGGVAALAGAAYFTATGRFPVAIPLGLFGLGLLNLLPKLASLGARTQPSPGQTSKVRARAIEMELDHDSGEMRGTFVGGKYAGVALESLDRAALVSVLPDLDEESRA